MLPHRPAARERAATATLLSQLETQPKMCTGLRAYVIFVSAWWTATLFTAYGIAVGLKHLYPFWPYISETATLYPESNVFQEMLNINSVLILVVFYCRYRQVGIAEGQHPRWVRLANISSLISGVLVSASLSLVGSFQEITFYDFHGIVGNIYFVVGICYTLSQTVICLKIKYDPVSKRLNVLRVFLSAAHIVSFILVKIYERLVANEFNGGVLESMNVDPSNPVYPKRLISTVSEWVYFGCFIVYLLTFAHEFKHLHLDVIFTDEHYASNESTLKFRGKSRTNH